MDIFAKQEQKLQQVTFYIIEILVMNECFTFENIWKIDFLVDDLILKSNQ